MKGHTICCAVAAAMLAASVAPALADTFKRITTEEKFRELVVDRKAVSEAGWFLVKSDGSASGNIFKKTFKGAWVWKNRMYCRNAVLGNETLKTDCQVVKISGDQVQFIRDYGKGATGTSTLE